MFDITLTELWHQLAYLGSGFRLATLFVVILLILVFIALPICMTILAIHQHFSSTGAQSIHSESSWLASVNTHTGWACAWLIVFLMLAQVAVILLRHVFDTGSIRLQELAWYLHGTVIMLGTGYTLLQRGHVRLDVWLRTQPTGRRVWVDLIGDIALLVPFATTLIWVSTSYVAQSFAIRESSATVGGLPLVFVMKILIVVFALLLLLAAAERCLVNRTKHHQLQPAEH